jgi:AsmA-like C-terminal region
MELPGESMDKATVYTKTAKGITQVNQKSASLSKDLMKVLKLIDGKSNFGQIMEKADLDQASLTKALNTLAKDGFARVFQVRKEEADPFASEDDFDFTAPGKMPAATQRVVPGAANDISELVRQQEKADAARKAATAAQGAATTKAKEQAEAKARAEAEAKARAEAETKALEQAQRAKEASERARAEVESKMREEAARKASAAAQQQKLSVEQKAKEEEEQRKLAEARVRAEREAKALAEARARAEAEAQAMAAARAAADAALKKQAAEASQADAAMKARMKEEIELRIRSEMEDLLRNEVEEKSRDEMRASILEEAKLAAKAELEERLREEREMIHKAEMEARTKGEAESRARADKEMKLRQEAEARAVAANAAAQRAEEEARKFKAQAEAAAQKAEEEARRIKALAEAESKKLREQAESDARRVREAEARAREESEARAREGAEVEKRVEAERRAKYEAEARARIDAEESEKRQRELQDTIESERKAKQEAEARARIEARARETIAEDTRAKVQAEIEGDMTKRAEIEGKAQAKAYMVAKEQAERDEDERLRGEQAKKAREIADILRTKVEPDEFVPADTPSGRRRSHRRRKGMLKTIVIALVASFVLAVGLLHVVPLRSIAVKVEKTLGVWMHDDVSIASLTFRLVPTPHLRVENVAIGKLLDAKVATGRIYLDLPTLFSERVSINSIEFDTVTISNDAVKRIPTWAAPDGKSSVGSIASIKLRNVTLDVKPALEPFDANLTFSKEGALQRAYLTSSKGWNLSLKPAEKGMDFELNARHWTPQVGLSQEVSDAAIKGNIAGKEITIPEFEATTMEGKVNGTLHVDWTTGIKVESELSLAKMDAKQVVSNFTKDVSVTGKLDGNFSFATEGPSIEEMFASPRAQGKFHIGDGSVSNVDLVAVMQSDAAGQRAGVTKFIEMNGEMSVAEHRVSYKSLTFQSGVLRGNGGLDIDAKSNLNGHLNLEIRSQVAQDRGVFSITGTVGRPNVKRGG